MSSFFTPGNLPVALSILYVHAARSLGWRIEGLVESPITGAEGNVEFLVNACRDPSLS